MLYNHVLTISNNNAFLELQAFHAVATDGTMRRKHVVKCIKAFKAFSKHNNLLLDELIFVGAVLFSMAIHIKVGKHCFNNFKFLSDTLEARESSTAFKNNPNMENFIHWTVNSTLKAKVSFNSNVFLITTSTKKLHMQHEMSFMLHLCLTHFTLTRFSFHENFGAPRKRYYKPGAAEEQPGTSASLDAPHSLPPISSTPSFLDDQDMPGTSNDQPTAETSQTRRRLFQRNISSETNTAATTKDDLPVFTPNKKKRNHRRKVVSASLQPHDVISDDQPSRKLCVLTMNYETFQLHQSSLQTCKLFNKAFLSWPLNTYISFFYNKLAKKSSLCSWNRMSNTCLFCLPHHCVVYFLCCFLAHFFASQVFKISLFFRLTLHYCNNF